ncbi:hypothetical protein GAYE_SCF54G6242 [Galdieria yellowstonensis]|uniref:RanBD1 domain-containing protein n=1 Tax=Galdieria yellowstonensis TaxID=3028027 RepID=A0AAV9ILN3_9RHOD|nr:hypothetical protein GAYE_SCF54G6242 [Galdieria yellowstonensis]
MGKRAAETQLTKDSQELEEEEKQEENVSLTKENSFARASEEEIARRRVIKARRLRPVFSNENSLLSTTSVEDSQNSQQDASSLSSNPFASVSLVPTTQTVQEEQEKDESEKSKETQEKNDKALQEEKTLSCQQVEQEKSEKVEEVSSSCTEKDTVSSEKAEKREETDHPSVPRSFGGFSGGEIHMDQLAKQSKGLQSSSTDSEFFWEQTKKTSNSDLQEEESEDVVDNADVPIEAKEPILPEQKTVTGEEEEETLLRIRGKLYSLEDKQWKEKGVGQLRVNVRQEDSRGRFVMRAEGNLRVLLNFPIHSEFRIEKASEKSLRFCAPGESGKPQSFLFRAFSKEDASKLETTCVEWLKSNKDNN